MATTLSNPTKLLPTFVTDKLAETKAFYVDKLGWTATYDMPGYLQVRSDGREGPELAFFRPDASPDGAKIASFAGGGVFVSVPVKDADEHHAEVRERGLAPASMPEVKPWGWRSYELADPNGVILRFFHVAAPPPGAAD
jgi:catechol 2,3-dioxygenase-like lactoylglutathione lyase family enzyme